MVFVHGGSLQVTEKDRFNASELASATGAIIVTIHYRLSVFGFLSTEDRAAPGSYGLGDCKLALQSTKRNIGGFGGDANGITIFGQSSGAYLGSTMLLDAQVRDSVHTSISFSESVLTDSIMGYRPGEKKLATELGTAVNCSVTTSDDLILCLKGLPVFLRQQKDLSRKPGIIIPYGLVIDGVHLHDEPLKAVEAASRLAVSGPDIFTGYLREDMSIILTILQYRIQNYIDPNTTLIIANVKGVIAKEFLTRGYTSWCSIPNYDLAQTVMDHYNFSNDDDRPTRLLKLFRMVNRTVNKQYGHYRVLWVYQSGHFGIPRVTEAFEWAFHQYDLANTFCPAQQLPGLTLDRKVIDSLRYLVGQAASNKPVAGSDLRDEQYLELDQSGDWNIQPLAQQPILDFWANIRALNKACNIKCANQQPYGVSY